MAGPTARTFAFAWAAVGVMTAAIVSVILVAGLRSGETYVGLWPAIALSLYGGVWTIMALIRRDPGDALTALGCFVFALICAALIGGAGIFAVLGLGIVLFFCGPGLRIVLKARR